jgi:hypothetical protein
MRFLANLASSIDAASPETKIQVVQSNLAQAYDEKYLASMYLERYSKITHVREFGQTINEAIKAYFSGYKLVAVMALIPVVEGTVRRIAMSQNRDVGPGTRKVVAEFDAFVAREMTSANCYGERLVMLEVLRDFVRDRLFESTGSYSGLNELNRHGILHGIYSGYGEDINFYRLITLLDLLCFSIGLLEGGVSCFAPEPTVESTKLAMNYMQLRILTSSVQTESKL